VNHLEGYLVIRSQSDGLYENVLNVPRGLDVCIVHDRKLDVIGDLIPGLAAPSGVLKKVRAAFDRLAGQ